MQEVDLPVGENESREGMTRGHSNILLTDAQIDEWEAERREIEAKIEEKKRELQRLNYMLEAAYLFDPSKPKAQPTAEIRETITEAIIRTLSETPDPLPRNEIRKRLRLSGMKNPALEGGYFYTVLAKLVRKGAICEMSGLYARAPFDTLDYSPPSQQNESQGNSEVTDAPHAKGRRAGPLRALVLETLRRSETPIDKRVLKAHVTSVAALNPAINSDSYAPLIHLLKKAKIITEQDGELDIADRIQTGGSESGQT